MKIAIIGSRSIESLDLSKFLPDNVSCIISGGARGVDSIAAAYAISHGIELQEILPDYSKYPGRVAPLKRNDLIVAACDMLIAFWDGASKGTKYTFEKAQKAGKEVVIYRV